ncbi:hypothetical protein [Halomonas sp. BMC6]|uniref:hypothetical protein n=1 Tax=Halomonas sp. BMC6 TaxID=3073244 RepID=UPI0030CC5598
MAYKSAVKANLSIVNQGKLEECLTLIYEIESVYWEKLDQIRRIPKNHGLVEAQAVVGTSDPEGVVKTAAKVHTLIKLHSPQMKSKAQMLLARAMISRDLFNYLNDRRGEGSEDAGEGWRGISSELAIAIAELCSEIKKHLENKAKTY